MSDTLTLHEITIECHLGVEEWERAVPQPVWIDLELAIDAALVARSDGMRHAVDYARVIATVAEVAQRGSFKLMETLAERIAARLVSDFAIPKLTVRVRKKALPGLGYAEVAIERTAARRAVLRRARSRADSSAR